MPSPSPHDSAVSPVIGIILLVALTVVFVAVVIAVGMGLAGGDLSSKSVGLILDTYTTASGTAGEPEHGVTVTVMNGRDAGDIAEMHVYIDGPGLYYLKQGNTNVTFPVLGAPYHYFADAGTYLKLYNDTWVRTNKLNNTEALVNKLATVVGKFTDGTEHVLLQTYITIPAMTGVHQQFNYTYVSVQTFTNTTGIPGHGLMVSLINPNAASVNSIELDVTDIDGRPLPPAYATLTKPHASGDGYFFFYLDAGSEVKNTPYNTFRGTLADPTEQLIGTAKIFVTLKDASQVSETVPVNIPARINIFENSSIAAGNLTSTTTSGKIANLTFSLLPSNAKKIVYGLETAHLQLGYIPSIQGNFYELGNTDKGTRNFLQQHPQDTLEAYVLVEIGSTSVWYRVATIPVNDILTSTS